MREQLMREQLMQEQFMREQLMQEQFMREQLMREQLMRELRRVNLGKLRVRIVPPIAVVAEFLDCMLGVEIRLQRRPLRFSGIDSSSPLL
ncbi:hypothetical protein, partial [Paenibacillus sp. HGF5]|uniref:hypothetical protein n=1 Tax=Paenibacillus sp. HGF5 TaxID=908341 RepID=UPI001C30F0CF